MGNKQSIPKEILDRIEDLKQRIQEGKFSNNAKGIEDIENLLGYWDKKYGIAGQKVEDGNVLLKNHFNCETIVEKEFCNKRGDSKCRWDPIDRFADESEDKKNFNLYGGICKDVDGVTEDDYKRQGNKYIAAKKKGEIFVKIDDWKNNSVLFKNVDTGETVSEIPEGSRLATNADKKKLDRKTRGMVDEANSISKDLDQPKTGNSARLSPFMSETGGSRKTKDGGSKRLRKSRKRRKSRKSRKRRKRRKSHKK
jgi:hypothetical protein